MVIIIIITVIAVTIAIAINIVVTLCLSSLILSHQMKHNYENINTIYYA